MLNPPGDRTWYCVSFDMTCSRDELFATSIVSDIRIQEKVKDLGITVKWEYGMEWDLFLHLYWDGSRDQLIPKVNECLVGTPYRAIRING